jgi:hypothetical protein
MKINRTKLNKIIGLISSDLMEIVLDMIPVDSARDYSGMRIEYNKKRGLPQKDNAFAHTLMVLKKNNLVKKDNTGFWMLTRTGIAFLELKRNFEKLCIEYEMSDLNDEGRVEMVVIGRKI